MEIWLWRKLKQGFPGGSDGKEAACTAGDLGSIPGVERSAPGGGNGNPFQYSCLESSMDTGVWWAALHGVAKSWTWLSMHLHACNHIIIIMIITYIKSSHNTALTSKQTPDWQHSFVIWPHASRLKLFKSTEFITSYKPLTPQCLWTLYFLDCGLWLLPG